MDLEEALNKIVELSREELLRAVGGLPPASLHASHLAMDALDAVLQQLSMKN